MVELTAWRSRGSSLQHRRLRQDPIKLAAKSGRPSAVSRSYPDGTAIGGAAEASTTYEAQSGHRTPSCLGGPPLPDKRPNGRDVGRRSAGEDSRSEPQGAPDQPSVGARPAAKRGGSEERRRKRDGGNPPRRPKAAATPPVRGTSWYAPPPPARTDRAVPTRTNRGLAGDRTEERFPLCTAQCVGVTAQSRHSRTFDVCADPERRGWHRVMRWRFDIKAAAPAVSFLPTPPVRSGRGISPRYLGTLRRAALPCVPPSTACGLPWRSRPEGVP